MYDSLCYVSSAQRRLFPAELEDLLLLARQRNQRHGLSGLLLYCDGNFMQYIEGPADGLGPVWSSIQRDPRHRGIIVIFHHAIEKPVFGEWNMAFKAPGRVHFAEAVAASERARQSGERQPLVDLLWRFWTSNS